MDRKKLELYRRNMSELWELKNALNSGKCEAGDFLAEMYRMRIVFLEWQCAEIEKYIEAIPDSLTRRIFRMKFLEGKTQAEIGAAVHLDRSRISRKIKAHFEAEAEKEAERKRTFM